MANKRIILAVVACFSIALFTGQTLSWARASNRTPMLLAPPLERLRGLTDEEKAKAFEKWHTEREQQKRRNSEERMRLMQREAWKRLLRINERQWKILEPKINKVPVLFQTIWAGAYYGGTENFHWHRNSERFMRHAKDPHEMIEGKKIADELIDLLEDEISTDEDIRKKIDELQQVKEKARKELHQVGRELAPLLTTPRQEAIFLIMGFID